MSIIRKAPILMAGAAIAVAGGLTALDARTAGAAELKLAHFMSPRHPMDSKVMRPWTEQVKKMSGGSLTIRIYPGGELGKGPRAQYKRAVDGVADMTFGLQGYTSAQFPLTTLIENTGLGRGAAEATRKLWAAKDLIADEYKRVKLIAMWAGEDDTLMTKDKPVRSLADLRGMKIRTPSKAKAALIKALGATPVAMPITKAYHALNTGVVDALLVPPSVIRSFKIGEVAKYFTTGIPTGHSPFFIAMNRRSWDGLSAEHKALIEKTAGAKLSTLAAAVYDKAGAGGLKSVTGTGKHEIIALPPEEIAKAQALLLAARQQIVSELEAKGIPAKAVIAAMEGG